MKKKKIRALVLYSGGLDSKLVVHLLKEQGIKVIPIFFKLPFGGSGNLNYIIPGMKIIDCTKGKLLKEYLKILKSPKYGRGAGINPCIDCKIFIFEKAKSFLKKFGCDFIATGEVLGQRPMSQTSKAMKIIDNQIKGIKRPLIERGIFGRSRKAQIALAKKHKIDYPSPAGGCLLCEKEYAPKLRDLFKNCGKLNLNHIKSIRSFRHFRRNGKIILARNEKECKELEKLNKKLNYHIIIPKISGPTCLYENSADKSLAEELIKAYSSKNPGLRKQFWGIKI